MVKLDFYDFRVDRYHRRIRPKKISVFPLTRPTLFFCADPAIFMAFQKKIQIFSYLLTLTFFSKLDKQLKKVRIAKIMLKIIFFNFPDVLNFIFCMFSGTVDEI